MRKGIENPMVDKFNSTGNVLRYHDGDIIIGKGIGTVGESIPVLAEAVLFDFCRAGEMQFQFDEQTLKLQQGDCFFFPKNATISGYQFSPDYRCDFIAIKDKLWSSVFHDISQTPMLMEHIYQNPVLHPDRVQRQQIDTLFELIYDAVEQQSMEEHPATMKRLVEAFVSLLFDVVYDRLVASGQLPDAGNLHGDQLVRKFIILQQDATREGRTVGDLAARLNVTPKYLSALVKKSTGKSPMDIITETTVQAIANRLCFSSASITEIAVELHFDNLSFFGKYVRKHLGMSPTEYREKFGKPKQIRL